MISQMKERTAELQRRLGDADVDLAVLTDQDSIAYYGGFWGYLGVEFGRPTFMLVPRDGALTVITPLMESEMVGDMTWVEDIRAWEDAGENRWDAVLGRFLDEHGGAAALGWERLKVPTLVLDFLEAHVGRARLQPAAGEVSILRSIFVMGDFLLDLSPLRACWPHWSNLSRKHGHLRVLG